MNISDLIRAYMESNEDVQALREEAPDKANPIFIFGMVDGDSFYLSGSTLRSGVRMPNFAMALIRDKAGLQEFVACRAYQMGIVHGVRAYGELPAITGPTFGPKGEILYESSSYADELEMMVDDRKPRS